MKLFVVISLCLLTFSHKIGSTGAVNVTKRVASSVPRVTGIRLCDPAVPHCDSYQGKVIYYQTMAPTSIRAHATFISSTQTDPTSSNQITFQPDSSTVNNEALLKIPLIPPGEFEKSAPVTIEMTVANDVELATGRDSDLMFGLSDGDNFLGIFLLDTTNYNSFTPCIEVEGKPGYVLGSRIFRDFSSPLLPTSQRAFYPGRFKLTFKVNEGIAYCYTAQAAGYLKEAQYLRSLDISKGLTLEVYRDEKDETYGIKLIKVAIILQEETFS
ncbi:uncharacterized protein [Montipora foliosa]|uniref:uncharacterized protein isoform X2 n=1 Tax=Montipora foliosa TaxID=591990 RepID=UPI0035F1BD5C